MVKPFSFNKEQLVFPFSHSCQPIFSIFIHCSLCLGWCVLAAWTHLLLFLYRDKSLINIKRTLAGKQKLFEFRAASGKCVPKSK